jgi:hypothetical protein
MKVEGACHCGRIAFEAEVDQDGIGLCHCIDCQTLSGSPYRSVIGAKPGTFRLLRREPKTYIKVAESGARRLHAFCPDCGSPVYSTSAENPANYTLRVGTLDQRYELRPRRQIWAKRRLPWCEDLSVIPSIEGQPGA